MKASFKKGFTLVEILIVVAIIGLLAGLAVPSILAANRQSRARIFANDLRIASDAFTSFIFENDQYPKDQYPTEVPSGMSGYLSNFPWSEKTAIGGHWDWDYDVFGVTAAISVHQPSFSKDQMEKIDAIIDDGSLGSGQFRIRTSGYMYVIEEGGE